MAETTHLRAHIRAVLLRLLRIIGGPSPM